MDGIKTELIAKGEIAGLFAKRKKDTDKRDYGDVVLFAGSPGMAGAVILGAEAALRSGSGLVRVATCEENRLPLHIAIPEAIHTTTLNALERLEREEYQAVGIGPGLGISDESTKLVKSVLKKCSARPVVLDADALNIITNDDECRELVAAMDGNAVMTPHRREAKRLFGGETDDFSREEVAIELSKKYNAIILLKGYGTLIAEPNSSVIMENPTGNPGMATAGSGDVLTGIILSLMGQGLAPLKAAEAGAYIHGLAGDLAALKLGERSLIAGDIIEYLPQAFMDLEEGIKVFS